MHVFCYNSLSLFASVGTILVFVHLTTCNSGICIYFYEGSKVLSDVFSIDAAGRCPGKSATPEEHSGARFCFRRSKLV